MLAVCSKCVSPVSLGHFRAESRRKPGKRRNVFKSVKKCLPFLRNGRNGGNGRNERNERNAF
jgi:hypothetical protein